MQCTDSNALAEMFAAARRARKEWSRTPFKARAEVIARFHDRMIDRNADILDTIQAETGKARKDALAEIVTVAGTARYYLTHGERALAPQRRRGAIPVFTAAALRRMPLGVIGVISPWNYPFLLAIADALPALLAGNAVIVKPSELTPFSAVIGRQLLIESGLHPDLIGIAQGDARVGAQLISLVDQISFTGGAANGRKVAMAAAERLIPFCLELGGKNPMIVLKGAPLAQAVQALLVGAFSNSGQTCISIERVYIEDSIFEDFADRVAAGAAKLKLGWSRSWDMDMGSLIHPRHASSVVARIEEAVDAGAQVLAGGRRRDDLGPSFVAPTVLANVEASSRLAKEEVFGPVISLHRVRDVDEAIALANDSAYGLNASVWAAGSAEEMRVASEIEAGSVGIHATLLGYNTFDLPMGGIKQSGIGRRHSAEGILRYTQPQSIVRSFKAGGGYDAVLTKIRSESTAKNLLRLVRWWRRIPGIR
jgi:succinate-semialdehyde dehydrogenase/glutarate-semialdehyde dehydrogenase